ncbi:SLC13 family permease [Desulforamulus aquiferis]|uniref:SLC13 family permease n=1 Tax=Desulforamulus aquiferis TaxID=1397668 RepID=A0AAW7ZBK6_9FIRM|nr:SLC13 family permease [Desulforamulus aquiferis]MDO7786610.1 SLC13 family permease [Desulforamulus aquiferis]
MNKTISASVAQTAPPNNTLYYIHCVIGLLFMFGFGSLAPFEPITPVGMQVLGVFIGLIYLWSFVSILWPSLLGIVALSITEYASLKEVLMSSFGDTVPVLVLFAMILFGAIQHAGVTQYISRWFLTRKMINGRPVIFSFIFIYTAYVLAALSANILPALLLMWSILYNVLKDVGYKKGDKYTAIMVVGTMFGAISGQAAKPFTGSALMIVGSFEKVTKTQLDYLPYMVFGFVMCSLGIVIYSLLIKFVFRPDMSKIANINTERFEQDKLPPMTLQQKILFGCLFGYLILILLPSILPKTIGVIAFIDKIGPVGVVLFFIVGLCSIKVDNKPVIDFKEIIGRYVTWDVYFLVCMAMVISGALTGEGTGIKEFTIQALNPLLGDRSPIVFATILLLFSMTITNIANNGVMGVLLMPIIYTFASQNGANPVAITTAVIFALHMAILTPAASPYAAILIGNKEWVDPKDVLKYGGIIVISSFFLYLLIGMPLANLIY